MTLVPLRMDYEIGSAKLLGRFWAVIVDFNEEYKSKDCPNPAIALCIAALKARALSLNSKDET